MYVYIYIYIYISGVAQSCFHVDNPSAWSEMIRNHSELPGNYWKPVEIIKCLLFVENYPNRSNIIEIYRKLLTEIKNIRKHQTCTENYCLTDVRIPTDLPDA